MSKQIEVSCPCCSHVLTIDVRTQTVLRTAKPPETNAMGKAVLDESRWDEARDRVRERPEGSRDRMDAALDKERSREADLNDLFDKAKQRALRRDASNPEDESTSL